MAKRCVVETKQALVTGDQAVTTAQGEEGPDVEGPSTTPQFLPACPMADCVPGEEGPIERSPILAGLATDRD